MMWASVVFLTLLSVAAAITHSELTRTKEQESYVPHDMGLKNKNLGSELADLSPGTAAGEDAEKSEALGLGSGWFPAVSRASSSKRQLPQLSAPRLFRRPIAVSAEAAKPQQPMNGISLSEAPQYSQPQARPEQLPQQQSRGGAQSPSASAPVKHAFNRLRCWFNPVAC